MGKIFVTGGAGFIGSHFSNMMSKEGYEVFVYDNFSQYIKPPVGLIYLHNINYRYKNLLNKTTIIKGSTLNKDFMRRALKELDPEYIVHFGALPLANMAIENTEEAFDTLLGGTVNLLEIVRDSKTLKKFIYISSSMVYGNFINDPIDEEDLKEPIEIYGGMKLSGEYIVKVYSKRYGIPYTIIRPSAVYGEADNNNRVVEKFLNQAINNEKINTENGDTSFLDFTYVKDLVQGIKLVLLSKESQNECFNLTRGRKRKISDLVNIIKIIFPNLVCEDKIIDNFRPNRGTLSIKKAEKLLGYNPKFDLEDGVPVCANYLKEFYHNT